MIFLEDLYAVDYEMNPGYAQDSFRVPLEGIYELIPQFPRYG